MRKVSGFRQFKKFLNILSIDSYQVPGNHLYNQDRLHNLYRVSQFYLQVRLDRFRQETSILIRHHTFMLPKVQRSSVEVVVLSFYIRIKSVSTHINIFTKYTVTEYHGMEWTFNRPVERVRTYRVWLSTESKALWSNVLHEILYCSRKCISMLVTLPSKRVRIYSFGR